MKLFAICIVAIVVPLIIAHPAPKEHSAVVAITDPDPLTESELESLLEVTRSKRSGSGDILSGLKRGILSSIGHASAHLAASSSGKLSKSNSIEHGHGDYHDTRDATKDAFRLKKQILNTLFQAVKAITGGVTALKGQLIKGSGYLINKGGTLLQAGGDGITNVGNRIVQSASLVGTDVAVETLDYAHPPIGHEVAHYHTGGHTGYGYGGAAYLPPSSNLVYIPAGKGGDYHGSHGEVPSSSSSVSAPSGSVHESGYVQLPYPVPFKTQYEQLHSSLSGKHASTSSSSSFLTSPGAVSSYAAPPSGHDSSHLSSSSSSSSDPSVQHAADALREILKKKIPFSSHSHSEIPQKQYTNYVTTNTLDSSSNSYQLSHDHDVNNSPSVLDGSNGNVNGHSSELLQPETVEFNKVEQYEIPPDPRTYVPAFKPLLGPVMPVETIYQTHTIHTAYGVPTGTHLVKSGKTGTDYSKGSINQNAINLNYEAPKGHTAAYLPPSAPPQSSFSNAPSSYLPPISPQAPPSLIQPPFQSYTGDSYNNNNYYKMHGKRSNKISPPLNPNFNRPRRPLGPIQPPSLDNTIHQQQIKQLQNSLGSDFEIQKSVTIELNGDPPRPPQIKRRVHMTKPKYQRIRPIYKY